MATTPPTVSQISANIIAQLESTLNQAIPGLPRAFYRVSAKAIAAVYVILYKYGGFIALQQFVTFASDKEVTINGKTLIPLQEWGVLVGEGLPNAATRAEMTTTITVEQEGGTIFAGQLLYNTANGYTYRLLSSVVLVGATVTGLVRAVSDQTDTGGRGALGNLSPGDPLLFATPQTGASTETTVLAQVVTAANAESTDDYRRRVSTRFSARPQGGAASDYRIWSEEVEGIVRAYPYTGVDPGTVDVFVEATPESSGSPDGIPTGAQLDAVTDSINTDENGLATRRNINALPNVQAITRTAFVTTVTGISGVDDLATVEDDVEAALVEYFLNAEPFIDGLDLPPRSDRITETAATAVAEDIITAANGIFTDLEVTLLAVPTPSYTLTTGEKAKTTVAFA